MEEKLLEEMSATVDEGVSEFADRRIAVEASLCPCYRFRKDMRRANLGCCFLWGYVHLILALSVLFNVIAFGITKQRCFLYLGIISALVFGLYTAYFRMRIRQQFNIKLGSGISGVATMPEAAASVVSCSGATTVVSCGSGGGIFTIDEPSVSTSVGSSTFQDCHKPQLMGSTMQIPTFSVSPPPMDWNQTTIRNSGRAGNYSHAMHQDDLSSRPYFEQDTSINYAGDSSSNPFLDTNQSLIQQHNRLSFSNKAGDCSFPLPSTCYYDGRSQNYSSPMSGGYRPTNQLHFSSNTAYWNAPAVAAASEEARPVFYSSMPALGQIFEHNLSSNLTKNLNSEGARELSCSTTKKSSISSTSREHAFKKTQIVTPTPLPLPTFKVRKEKLGDSITALQQLVSPFGKTDTASVLYEAIGYIKFLHDQVNVLSTPYLKNQHPMQHHQNSDAGGGPNKDLRSRGLCLVPIASMYPVASEIPAVSGLLPLGE